MQVIQSVVEQEDGMLLIGLDRDDHLRRDRLFPTQHPPEILWRRRGTDVAGIVTLPARLPFIDFSRQPLWVQGNAGDNFVRPVEDVLGIANE